eukprot:2546796-Rhodomonas_salina.1
MRPIPSSSGSLSALTCPPFLDPVSTCAWSLVVIACVAVALCSVKLPPQPASKSFEPPPFPLNPRLSTLSLPPTRSLDPQP